MAGEKGGPELVSVKDYRYSEYPKVMYTRKNDPAHKITFQSAADEAAYRESNPAQELGDNPSFKKEQPKFEGMSVGDMAAENLRAAQEAASEAEARAKSLESELAMTKKQLEDANKQLNAPKK